MTVQFFLGASPSDKSRNNQSIANIAWPHSRNCQLEIRYIAHTLSTEIVVHPSSSVVESMAHHTIIFYLKSIERSIGSCNSELNVWTPQGIYNWTEGHVGETLNQPCYYTNLNTPNTMDTVSRTCLGHQTWGEIKTERCITLATSMIQKLRTLVSNSSCFIYKLHVQLSIYLLEIKINFLVKYMYRHTSLLIIT